MRLPVRAQALAQLPIFTFSHTPPPGPADDNSHSANVYAYVNTAFGICNQLKGHPDRFFDNHCVQQQSSYGGGQQCTTTGSVDATVVHGNTMYTPTGAFTECGTSLANWQAQGGDPGTVALPTPDDATLLALARGVLGM